MQMIGGFHGSYSDILMYLPLNFFWFRTTRFKWNWSSRLIPNSYYNFVNKMQPLQLENRTNSIWWWLDAAVRLSWATTHSFCKEVGDLFWWVYFVLFFVFFRSFFNKFLFYMSYLLVTQNSSSFKLVKRSKNCPLLDCLHSEPEIFADMWKHLPILRIYHL